MSSNLTDPALTIIDRGVARTIDGDLRPLLRIDTTNRPDLEDLRRVLLRESDGIGEGVSNWRFVGSRVTLEVMCTSPVRCGYSLAFTPQDRALLDAAARCGWLGLAATHGAFITWLETRGLHDVLAQLDTAKAYIARS